MASQQKDFIKISLPEESPQTKPVDPAKRLAVSEIKIELADEKDAYRFVGPYNSNLRFLCLTSLQGRRFVPFLHRSLPKQGGTTSPSPSNPGDLHRASGKEDSAIYLRAWRVLGQSRSHPLFYHHWRSILGWAHSSRA